MPATQKGKRIPPRQPPPKQTPPDAYSRFRKYHIFGLSILATIASFGLLTSRAFSAQNFLVSWIIGALVYVVLSFWRMLRSDVHQIRRRAADLDFSDVLLLLFCILAALASIGGIGLELSGTKNAPPQVALEGAGLAILTIFVSWVFLHTMFTTHYAHRFYADHSKKPAIRFPDDIPEPDYWDFLYFSFTIGVAAQTADVAIATTQMRRLALLHALLSFVFNTTILALAVNVGASLLQG